VTYVPFAPKPGVFTDITALTAEDAWTDAARFRFRYGKAEPIGGWTQHVDDLDLVGTARVVKPFLTLDGTLYIAYGSEKIFGLIEGSTHYDITPYDYAKSGALGSNPITTYSNTTIRVTLTAHDAAVGDIVYLTGLAIFNGIDPNGVWEITTIVNANNFEFTHFDTASASSSGGGASGFYALTGITLANNPITTSSGTGNLTIAVTAHGLTLGTRVTISGAATFNGINPNGTWETTNVADPNAVIVSTTGTATSSGVGGGAAVRYSATIAPGSNTGTALRSPSIETWGEDLALCPGPDTRVYVWSGAGGPNKRAIEIYEAPDADFLLVSSEDKHLIAFGSGGDDLGYDWSDDGNLREWTAAATTSAGGDRLFRGSTFVAAISTTNDNIILTDVSLHTMTFVGLPNVFAVRYVDKTTILGPKAIVEGGNGTVYWMGNGNFYSYDGRVNKLSNCSCLRRVFKDLNFEQARAVCAGTNTEFNEVWWFYPSASALQNDKYIIYNYEEDCWYPGDFGRSAWIDRDIIERPLAATSNGFLYEHEDGTSADGQPLAAWIQSGEIQSTDPETNARGNAMMNFKGYIPDAIMEGSLDVVVKFKKYPRGPEWSVRNRLTESTKLVKRRARCRSYQFRIETPNYLYEELSTEDGEILTAQSNAEPLTTENDTRDVTEDLLAYARLGVFRVDVSPAGRL
jgi:hypothetical protein